MAQHVKSLPAILASKVGMWTLAHVLVVPLQTQLPVFPGKAMEMAQVPESLPPTWEI